MKLKFAMALAAGLALAGCSAGWEVSYDEAIPAEVSRGWSLSGVSVTVPDELTTSEENTFAPEFDVIWHGDPPGDRKAQVAAVMREGTRRGASALPGSRPVVVALRLQQFHAVTPLAVLRAPSAVHDIRYIAQVFDAQTGAPLTEPLQVNADLEALVGTVALEAQQIGQTQKVRITDHLEKVTQGWLGIGPDPRRTFTSIGR